MNQYLFICYQSTLKVNSRSKQICWDGRELGIDTFDNIENKMKGIHTVLTYREDKKRE